jgi:hypothetical protein
MVKLLILFCLFVLVSCQKNQCQEVSGAQAQDEKCDASTSPDLPKVDPDKGSDVPPSEPLTGDLPPEAQTFNASVVLTNFERDDEDKVLKAIEIIKKVIASSEFRTRVLSFSFEGKNSFVDNKGLTNEQIYQKLLEGAEDLAPEKDNEMDLDLELYYSWRSTVGYTYPNGLKIWMNRKYFDVYTPAEVAGNVFHEWTHKLGFEHASSYSVSRNSSVPYALGYLIEELGKNYE